MPRISRRRQLLSQNRRFPRGMVPSEYTFDRIVAKLKEFQESSAKLRLIHFHTPSSSHWARQRDREVQRDQQALRTAEHRRAVAAAAEATAAGLPPPPKSAPGQLPKRRPMPVGTYAGAYPALQSRLLVLDASFNPPTRAHAYMAKAAVRDVLKEQRAAVAAAESAAKAVADVDGVDPVPVVRPETRLLLLLAVTNADKDAQPAPLEHRLAMLYAFMQHLRGELRELGDSVPIDMAVTSEPFFAGKAQALKTESWYPNVQPRATFKNCDALGRRLPGTLVLPPIDFITGFDTLVRILDPRYYKEEVTQEAAGDGEAATAAGESGQDVGMPDGGEMSAQASSEPPAVATAPAPAPAPAPTPASAPASAPAAPLTPMRRTLNPFFEHASLRVLLRPDGLFGSRADQKQYIAALAGDADAGSSMCSLEAIGGDNAWMRKVHVLAPAGASTASGVSSSKVRKRVEEGSAMSVTGYVYPLVQDWIQKRRLYKKPRPLKESSEDEEGMVEIKEFGFWKKADFFD